MANYTVHHDGGNTPAVVSQNGSNVLTFADLGRFGLSVGESHGVTLNTDGSDGYLIADAVEFIPVDVPLDVPGVVGLSHAPVLPTSADSVTVSAVVEYSGATPVATLTWRRGLTGEVAEVPMTPASAKGEVRTYTAVIPALPDMEFVEYGVEVAEPEGLRDFVGHRVYQVNDGEAAAPLVFVVAGQSNACGPGELNENNETSDHAVLMLGSDYRWKVAYEPITDATGRVDVVANCPWTPDTARGHGFGLRACKDLLSATGASTRLIPTAKGGSSLSEWQAAADTFDRTTLFGSMNYRRAVGAPEGVTAFWWYQGESDSGSASFVQNHRDFIASVRDEIADDLPVVSAQLAGSNSASYNANLFATAEKQRAMETGSGTPDEIERHHLVVTFDLPMLDHVHLDQDATKELGRRFALATREHVLGEDIDGTGPRPRRNDPVVRDRNDDTRLLVVFDRAIDVPNTGSAIHFRAGPPGSLQTPLAATRDPQNDNVVILEMPGSAGPDWVLTYGAAPASALHTWRTNVITGANDLPAPRFGPVPVTEAGETAHWSIR